MSIFRDGLFADKVALITGGGTGIGRGITEGLRLDLLGTGVRVTSVDPGLLRSEFGLVRFRGDAARAEAVYEGMTPLSPDDVAEVVVFAATRPPHVTLAEALVLPTQQGSSVHVHRGRHEHLGSQLASG